MDKLEVGTDNICFDSDDYPTPGVKNQNVEVLKVAELMYTSAGI